MTRTAAAGLASILRSIIRGATQRPLLRPAMRDSRLPPLHLPTSLAVAVWLVRDTFRQALASGTSQLLLGLSGVGILVCLGVGGDATSARAGAAGSLPSEFSLAFGGWHLPAGGGGPEHIRLAQLLFAG